MSRNIIRSNNKSVTWPRRTVMKALKMSVIHVVAFIVSWTPYTVMGTWWATQELSTYQ